MYRADGDHSVRHADPGRLAVDADQRADADKRGHEFQRQIWMFTETWVYTATFAVTATEINDGDDILNIAVFDTNETAAAKRQCKHDTLRVPPLPAPATIFRAMPSAGPPEQRPVRRQVPPDKLVNQTRPAARSNPYGTPGLRR